MRIQQVSFSKTRGLICGLAIKARDHFYKKKTPYVRYNAVIRLSLFGHHKISTSHFHDAKPAEICLKIV